MALTAYQLDPNGFPRANNNIGIPIPFDPNATAVGAANAAVSLQINTDNDKFIEIDQIDYSYSAAPVGGGIQVLDGATVLWQRDIVNAADSIYFMQPRSGGKGRSLTITLAAGGGSAVGKINVCAWARK